MGAPVVQGEAVLPGAGAGEAVLREEALATMELRPAKPKTPRPAIEQFRFPQTANPTPIPKRKTDPKKTQNPALMGSSEPHAVLAEGEVVHAQPCVVMRKGPLAGARSVGAVKGRMQRHEPAGLVLLQRVLLGDVRLRGVNPAPEKKTLNPLSISHH